MHIGKAEENLSLFADARGRDAENSEELPKNLLDRWRHSAKLQDVPKHNEQQNFRGIPTCSQCKNWKKKF